MDIAPPEKVYYVMMFDQIMCIEKPCNPSTILLNIIILNAKIANFKPLNFFRNTCISINV